MSEADQKQHSTGQDRFNGFLLGFIFILAGGLVFADHHGLLDAGWFWWLVMGVGMIFLLESVIRLALPQYHGLVVSRVIWGSILVAIGGSQIVRLENWWPLIFILAGALMIISSVRKIHR